MTAGARPKFPVVPLKYVNELYYGGVFGDFEEVVRERISLLRSKPTWENLEKARFFEYLLAQVDHKKYAALQQAYLCPPAMESGSLKYLDPVSWFEQKFKYAFQLRLHERKPIRILDVGSGAGHFMVIARFYGHDVVGTELPDHVALNRPTHLYNELADIFGTVRVKHRILPLQELSDLPSGIDLVTSFSIAFNMMPTGLLWGIRDWEFFLRSLKQHVLAKDGALFMMLVKKKVRDDVWDYLASVAEWSDPKALLVRITNRDTSKVSTKAVAGKRSSREKGIGKSK